MLIVSPAFAIPAGGSGDVSGVASTTDVALLIFYIVLALLVSFLCSIAEAVLLSITPTYIEGQQARNPKLARLLKKVKQDRIDQSLAAILTLNTIAHTVGAIGAGAKATIVFGNVWFGLFSAVMTLLILFLSEIIPKTLGAVHWERLVKPVALYVQVLVYVLYPLVWLSERLTRLFSRNKAGYRITREEILAMVRIGEQTGNVLGQEHSMIRNLFRFRQLKVEDIMTPRTVISALPQSMTIGEAAEQVASVPFSRLPVYEETIDRVTGFVLKHDLLFQAAQTETASTLTTLRRDILSVPEIITLPDLFQHLLAQRAHIALVVDEHGGTGGLVTLEDLVETLVGEEIMDESDQVANLRDVARKRWKRRGGARVQ
ncbi:hemolysin family protein [bacterium]|nr:hemolysin family protein [bacterium]